MSRFRIRERLGSGGFGTVYRAWDERLQRDVAVKVVELAGQPVDRVLREAQAVGRLNHSSVVTLYELGEDGHRAYLVSELVEGATLAELQRAGSLNDHEVGEAGSDLCGALRHAHERGVVHRDIKPQNVLLATRGGRAKLMDFGIARVLDQGGLTATGDVLGTLAYMAPEQAEGGSAGPAADVYSLALTLYEAWSGENPFARATPAATARAIGSAAAPLTKLRPDLPPQLCATIDACLEVEPQWRPALDELADTIEASLPELDRGRAVPRAEHGVVPPEEFVPLFGGRAIAVGSAAATTALAAATMIAAGGGGPFWAYPLPVAAGLVALLWPRLGYLLGAGGLVIWLAGPGGRPGAALLVCGMALPGALAITSARSLCMPAASPLLGLFGAAPVYPALAGLAGRARDRVLLGAIGYVWLAIAEAALGQKLLFGGEAAAQGWQASAGAAFNDLLLPLAGDPSTYFGVLLWSLGALALGWVVRGRNPALDLLGALMWAAALFAALRLRGVATGASPALLALAMLAVVCVVIVWRAREAAPRRPAALGPGPISMREAGREATLS